jgi:hypothetical protein
MHLTQIRVYKCSSSADRMHGAGSQCDASFSRPIHPPTRTKYVLNAPLPYVHYVFCSCGWLAAQNSHHGIWCAPVYFIFTRLLLWCAMNAFIYIICEWMHNIHSVCIRECIAHYKKRKEGYICWASGTSLSTLGALQKSRTASWQPALIRNPRRSTCI